MALATSSMDTWTGTGCSSVDTDGTPDWGWGWGFFSCRATSVSLFGLAIRSSEEARQTAPLKSLSSSLAETLADKESSGSRVILLVHLLGAGWTGVGSAFYLINRLVWDAKHLRWPTLSGTHRQRAGEQNKRSQENSDFSEAMQSISQFSPWQITGSSRDSLQDFHRVPA